MAGNTLPPVSCHALLVTSTSSGQGKTLTTALLAKHFKEQNVSVCLFKCGPDFLDPLVLSTLTNAPVYQLDIGMMGEDECHTRLYQAATKHDILIIEGMMGLFDGDSPSASLAAKFGIPVVAVLDGSGMAQTFGAICQGLNNYRFNVKLFAAITNRVRSAGHYDMIHESLPDDVEGWGFIPPSKQKILNERHLGLVPTDIPYEEIDALYHSWGNKPNALPPLVSIEPPCVSIGVEPKLTGTTIAVAQDDAFCFIYQANLDLLSELGATLIYFSPLADQRLPACDSLYLPGGYPELHLAELANNQSMIHDIRNHAANNKPIVAECGGFLYLLNQLSYQGECTKLAGVIDGVGEVHETLQNIAMQTLQLEKQSITGHSFHHGSANVQTKPFAHAYRTGGNELGEPIYAQQRVLASFVHFYFPYNPALVAEWFQP